MAKSSLVVFFQSTFYPTYVNVITHCVKHEKIEDIYFVGKKVEPAKKFELREHIKKLREVLVEYVNKHPEIYQEVLDAFPDAEDINSYAIYTEFSQPQQLINQLKEKGLLDSRLIIDVTGCSKRLASDIITSYMAAGVSRIGYFELADKVHDHAVWKKSKMYHDLIEDYVTYYDYDDLTSDGVTAVSIDQLRGQGRVIKFLLLLTLLLAIAVVWLTISDQGNLAIIASLFLAVATAFGLIEDGLNIFERFRR